MKIKELLVMICQKKKNVLKLSNEELKEFKQNFYKIPQKSWKLDLLWEYLWGDISLEEIKNIFKIK